MFIGSASGSTGGGIKVNTLAVLILVVLATAGRRSEPEAFGRRIAVDTIARAVTVLVVSSFAVLVGVFVVSATGGFRGGPALFETVSAFGTVGLSLAGTPRHQDATSLVLSALMFLGRVGTDRPGDRAVRARRPAGSDPHAGADCAGRLMAMREEV